MTSATPVQRYICARSSSSVFWNSNVKRLRPENVPFPSQREQLRSVFCIASPEQRRQIEKEKMAYHGLNVRQGWKSGKYHAVCEHLPSARTGEVKEYTERSTHPHHISSHPHTVENQHLQMEGDHESLNNSDSKGCFPPSKHQIKARVQGKRYVKGNLSECGPDHTRYCEGESIFADQYVCYSAKYRQTQAGKGSNVQVHRQYQDSRQRK